jgi:hypothetical protein
VEGPAQCLRLAEVVHVRLRYKSGVDAAKDSASFGRQPGAEAC